MERPERKKNRRRATRILHADLLGYSDQRKDGLYHLLGTGRTVDLSETGLRMLSHEPLPLGKVLSFELKITEQTHRFRGRVVWCDELEADKRYEAGVRFQEVDFGLAKSLWELTGDVGSSEGIKVHDESGDSHAALEIQAVEFSPIANRPLPEDGAERELVRHLVGRSAGSNDPAPLEELLRRALAHSPQGGFSSPGDLRDALARAAESLAEKVQQETSGVSTALAPEAPAAESTSTEGKPAESKPAEPRAPSDRIPAISASGTPTPLRGVPALTLGGPPTPARGVPSVKAGRMTPPPRPGGMAGHFKGDQLIEFVQMLGLTRRTGMLEVIARRLSGHLAFREGCFVAASASDGAKGEAAIFAILLLHQGDFRFRPDLAPNLVAEHELPIEGILFEVARRRDEHTKDDSQEKPV